MSNIVNRGLNELPKQWQTEKFRYIMISPKSKVPPEGYQWTNPERHMKFNDPAIKHHLKAGGNIAVITGYGHLVVIDSDRPELSQELDKKLPRTMVEKTATGTHHSFIIKDWSGFLSLDIGDLHFGEGRGDKGHYTVISPSVHPTGIHYTITSDVPIAEITKEELFTALSPFMKKEHKYKIKDDISSEFNFPIDKHFDLSNLRDIGNNEYQGTHPIHGSTTGVNFCYNVQKNIWHCFRHNCGGTVLHLIGQKEGILECGESLTGQKFKQIIDVAKSKYGINIVDLYQNATKPITFTDIQNVLNLNIKSDDTNKTIVFASMLLAYSEDSQFNITFRAPSSSGKSFIALSVAEIFPERDIMTIAYSSPTSFFHESGDWDAEKKVIRIDLSRKILIFLDMPHDQLLQRLRPLLSHDKKELLVKITDKKERGGQRTKTVELIGFPSVIFCSSNSRIDEQEATRSFILSPEINQEKLRQAIEEKIKKSMDKGRYRTQLEKNDGRKLLKTRIRLIKMEGINDVIIKDEDVQKIRSMYLDQKIIMKPRHSRDLERLFSLIKCHAILNLWHRERDNKGNITATFNDVDAGLEVWEDIRDIQEKGLPPYIFTVFNEVIKPAYSEKTGLSKKDIAEKYYTVYQRGISSKLLENEILFALEQAGIIVQEPDPEDKRRILYHVTENYIPSKSVSENQKTPKNEEKSQKLTHPVTVYISKPLDGHLKSDCKPSDLSNNYCTNCGSMIKEALT